MSATLIAEKYANYIDEREYINQTPEMQQFYGGIFGWKGRTTRHILPGGQVQDWYKRKEEIVSRAYRECMEVLLENDCSQWQAIEHWLMVTGADAYEAAEIHNHHTTTE